MMVNERWVPAGSTAVELQGVDAVAYVNGLTAIGYAGKANKPKFYNSFRSEASRDEHVAKFLDSRKEWAEYKAKANAEKAAARAAWVPDLKAGDILYGSWGYEQTNVEFFEVLEVKGKRALVREVMHAEVGDSGANGMSANVVPRPGEYMAGEAFKAVWKPMLMGYCGGTRIKWSDYCSLTKWDGKPKYKSWYA